METRLRLLLLLAFLLLPAFAGCGGGTTSRALGIANGEMAGTLDRLDARVQALTDLVDRMRVDETGGGNAPAPLADRLQAEVGLLEPVCAQLRENLRSMSLFPDANSALDVSRLRSDADSLGSEAAKLDERSAAMSAIAGDARSAGLTADAREIDAAAALFRDAADRIHATADARAALADRTASSLGLRPE